MRYSAISDIGIKRKENEDCIFASSDAVGKLPNLFVVADGMGGHKAGDVASNMAVSCVCESVQNSSSSDIITLIKEAYKSANSKVLECSRGDADKEGMGTTLVLCTISDKLYVANVGDSRLYAFGDHRISQITKDHTVVEEMLRVGSISKDVAKRHPKRHMLTRAMGVDDDVMVDVFSLPMDGIEQILLCSDGLYNMLSDEQINSIVDNDEDVEIKAKKLIESANEMGGEDNVSAVLIDITR